MLHSAYRSAREFFLLRAREEAARVSTPEQTRRATSLLWAASACCSAGDELADAPQLFPAIVLFQEAAHLLLAALLVEKADGPSGEAADGASVVAAFGRLVEAGKLESPPAGVAAGIRFFGDPRRWEVVSAPREEQAQARDALAAAIRWLRPRLRVAALPEIRRARVFRVGTLGALVFGSVAWLIVWILTPTNLALHRPVRTSSVHPLSVAPLDGSGFVNGVREVGYGVHTNFEESPWVMVDLQRLYTISDIEVYNRGDGYFDEGLPFVLELSPDGQSFTVVSQRSTPFSQVAPWKFVGHGIRARYVRIRCPHPGYIALAEIEVHGRR